MALDDNVVPSLRRIAKAHLMVVFEAEAAEQAFGVVRRQEPPVIILQVGGAINEVLKFIRLVVATTHPVPLIVAATRHSTRIEREVLGAGARYYLPGVRQDIVERLLEAVIQPKEKAP